MWAGECVTSRGSKVPASKRAHEAGAAMAKPGMNEPGKDIDIPIIEPKPEYAPLFATMVTAQKVGYQEMDSSPSSRPMPTKDTVIGGGFNPGFLFKS